MKTSYFAKYKGDNAVSIARSTPMWFVGKMYTRLAPPWDSLNKYNSGEISKEEYTTQYTERVLNRLDAKEVYNELLELAGENAVLCCWERSSDFCHRHIVAAWLNRELNINIDEYVS